MMKSRKRLAKEGVKEIERSYFEFLADVGITVHMGGVRATEELAQLCHVEWGKRVLDVGCGIGVTACRFAKRYGCRVDGVDIQGKMIDWSRKRARREGVWVRVEFKVADAQKLPFKDGTFDAVIGESVVAFVADKQKAISEFTRVTKQGGYVGLNETSWVKTPPPPKLVELASLAEAEILTTDDWARLLEHSGLRDIVVKTYQVSALKEGVDRIRLVGFGHALRAWGRLLSQCVKSQGRREIKKWMDLSLYPQHMFQYMGYGIYVGRK